MPTSGTLLQTPFTVKDVIDHAARRAKIPSQRLGSEAISIIRKMLFLQLCEYVAVGFPLWTKQYNVLSITAGSANVKTLPGTIEALNTYWRIFMPYRGSATDASGNDVSTLFSGQPGSDVTIAGSNPAVQVNFTSATQVETVGVLLGGSVPITTALTVFTSSDGITFTNPQVLPSATYTSGSWVYFDLDPSPTAQYLRLQFTSVGSWTLNQVLFGLSGSQNIPNGPFNIDDYYNLPDLSFQGDRVTSCYIDRTLSVAPQLDAPTLRVWPAPNVAAFYAGTVSCLSRRYIQDPGAMTNTLEVPARWYKAMVSRLATQCIDEIDESVLLESGPAGQANSFAGYFKIQERMQLRKDLDAEATKAEAIIWAEERDKRGPMRLTPNISYYTR